MSSVGTVELAASSSASPSRANSRIELADSAIAAPISVSSGACSNTSAWIPRSCSARPRDSPPMPAPMIATRERDSAMPRKLGPLARLFAPGRHPGSKARRSRRPSGCTCGLRFADRSRSVESRRPTMIGRARGRRSRSVRRPDRRARGVAACPGRGRSRAAADGPAHGTGGDRQDVPDRAVPLRVDGTATPSRERRAVGGVRRLRGDRPAPPGRRSAGRTPAGRPAAGACPRGAGRCGGRAPRGAREARTADGRRPADRRRSLGGCRLAPSAALRPSQARRPPAS